MKKFIIYNDLADMIITSYKQEYSYKYLEWLMFFIVKRVKSKQIKKEDVIKWVEISFMANKLCKK